VHKEANCWTLLCNDLCRQAVTTGRLVLLSSGLQQRDFVTIEQVCRVINWLLRSDYRTLSATIFNVGSGASQTVFEMAQFIQVRCKEVLGFEPELNRPVVVGNEFHEPLCFKCENLKKTGFCISQTSVEEIDRLLIFCAKNFVE
jgi:UDP-glucose 4-epimerase